MKNEIAPRFRTTVYLTSAVLLMLQSAVLAQVPNSWTKTGSLAIGRHSHTQRLCCLMAKSWWREVKTTLCKAVRSCMTLLRVCMGAHGWPQRGTSRHLVVRFAAEP